MTRCVLRHADGRACPGHRYPQRGHEATLLLVINGHFDLVNFTLPESPGGNGWVRIADTNCTRRRRTPDVRIP